MSGPDRDEDRDLAARVGELPRAIAPGGDLWPGVARRIRARRRVRIAIATVSTLAAAAAVLFFVRMRASPPVAAVAPPAPVTAAPLAPTPTASVALLPGEGEYLHAIDGLSAELASHRRDIAASTLAVIDKSLAVIDDAIATSREALLAHPDDLDLQDELDRAYQDKVDLLRQALELGTGT